MPNQKRFVYVLKSGDSKVHFYVGVTSDIRARLSDHNDGRCPHTARYRPWQLHVAIELPDERRAIEFERYLKSGARICTTSGRSLQMGQLSRESSSSGTKTGIGMTRKGWLPYLPKMLTS